MKRLFSLFFACVTACVLLVTSCEAVGLGQEVDLEAPVLTVLKLKSGEQVLDSFSGGVYCKKSVSFEGKATDNSNIDNVYAELKWSDENTFTRIKNAELSGNSWTLDIDFEKEGACYVKIVAEDAAKNFSTKSSKVITLFVDETGPVANAWYIDRDLNGIQFNLKDKEALEAIDLDFPENKDASQNVRFILCATATDAFGIDSISVNIKDESGNILCTIPNSNATNMYAPKFPVTHDVLVAADSSLASGKHYLQISYDSTDVITFPAANQVEDAEVELGWFIWYPEMDEPQITSSDIEVEEETDEESLSAHVQDSLSFNFFDDDGLEKGYFALMTQEEFRTFAGSAGEITESKWAALQANPEFIKNAVKADSKNNEATDEEARQNRFCYFEANNERDATIVLKAAKESQTMHFVGLGFDNTTARKVARKDFPVTVSDESNPILLISDPKTNTIPAFNSDGETTDISGVTLDSSGCTYLEFAWVPSSCENKYEAAKSVLENIKTSEQHENYKGTVKVVSASSSKVKVWGAELSDSSESNGFYKQTFSLNVNLLEDFAFSGNNEKAEEKYFLVKLTRKDGNAVYQEYKLAADTALPSIVGITPSSDMQVVQDSEDLVLKFKAVKASGLAIDTSKYAIYRTDISPIVKITDSLEGYSGTGYNSTSGCYETKVSKDLLSAMNSNGERSKYRFYAEDIFGNSNYTEYTLVISELPVLKSISTSASENCKLGDEIKIVASFSKTVGVSGTPRLKIKGITNTKTAVASTDAVYADYSGGSGSTSITFTYKVKEGDKCTSGLTLYNSSPIDDNDSNSFVDSKVVLPEVSAEENASAKNNFDAKKIKIDGLVPAVSSCGFTCTGGALSGGVTYLKEGSVLTATLIMSEKVLVGSPIPSMQLIAGGDANKTVELPFTNITASGTKLVFQKTISADDSNGLLTYSLKSYIANASSITDSYGNAVQLSKTDTSEDVNYYIDTELPAKPSCTAVDWEGNSITLTDGTKYRDNVTFTLKKSVSDTAISVIQYSTDGGSNWLPSTGTAENTAVTLENSVSFTCRAIDKAGNISVIPDPIYLDIESSFPDFTVECTDSDGNYKAGQTLTLRVSFIRPVNVSLNSGAYITLSGNNSSDVCSGLAQISSSAVQNGVENIDFVYTVASGDDFVLKVASDAVHLTGIKDEYNISQGNKALSEDYVRTGIHCDGKVPAVSSMAHQDDSDAGTKDNVIVLTFDEPVIKNSGNITIRRKGTWALPPVLTVSEFNTICKKITSAQKNILCLQENGAEMEDSEWVNESKANYKNQYYHGTGQFVGPYKKMTQGILSTGEADITTKYVLDFDMGITETTAAHYYGKTFKSSTQTSPTTLTASNATKITAGDIRGVLEIAGYHKRVLDVTNAAVTVDGNTVTVVFPKGLCDENASLPSGIEWEVLVDQGAFMDETGNTMESYTSSSFLSQGVSTPVIRLDRYSYGLGIKQGTSTGGTETISGDTKMPSGYIRARIDCQTPDVSIKYVVDKSSSLASSFSTSKTVNDAYSKYKKAAAVTVASLKGKTLSSSYTNNSIIALGNGDFKTACRQYVAAQATHTTLGSSERGYEGVFQTVVKIIDPRQNSTSGYEVYQMEDKYDDFNIRGTTGWSGEPYISPFPLRDAQVGSPYLRLCYKGKAYSTASDYNKNYFWLSYETLVDTSFSGTARDSNEWDYIAGWGWVTPGGYSECYNMHTW